MLKLTEKLNPIWKVLVIDKKIIYELKFSFFFYTHDDLKPSLENILGLSWTVIDAYRIIMYRFPFKERDKKFKSFLLIFQTCFFSR